MLESHNLGKGLKIVRSMLAVGDDTRASVLLTSLEQIMLLEDDRYLVNPIYTDVGCEEM